MVFLRDRKNKRITRFRIIWTTTSPSKCEGTVKMTVYNRYIGTAYEAGKEQEDFQVNVETNMSGLKGLNGKCIPAMTKLEHSVLMAKARGYLHGVKAAYYNVQDDDFVWTNL